MLEIKGIRFSYGTSSKAKFFCFDLTVESGEIVLVEGVSGAGKSTLLNLIAGFLTPLSGVMRWHGQDILSLNPSERPLSMIFQDSNLFEHLTCRQNIALGLSPSLRLDDSAWHEVDMAMEQLGIIGLREVKPAQASGGQQQRVVLARSLVRAKNQNRGLLLFDEPFSALDPETRQDCIDAVLELMATRDLTAIIVSHDPADAVALGARLIPLP
jgi:thiamine transport system ATP-binding protein